MAETKEISLCGAVDLLAKIFDRDRDELRRRYGLPPTIRLCPECGKPCPPRNQFCSTKCWMASKHVKVVCSECGKIFELMQSQIIARHGGYNRPARKTEEIFCSKRCYGKWFGKRYGIQPGEKARLRKSQEVRRIVRTKKQLLVRWLRRLGFTKGEIVKQTGLNAMFVKLTLMGYDYQLYEDEISIKRKARRWLKPRGPRIAKQHIRVRWLAHLNFTEKEIIALTGCGKATHYRAVYLRR